MNNEKKKQTIAARQAVDKKAIIDQLKKAPIVQIACDRASVATTTYYRWRDEDEAFRLDSDRAQHEGEAFINDMSEAQVIALIKEKNWAAISFWLKHHHPKYATRVEVFAKATVEEKLNPEQEALLRKALRFSLAGDRRLRKAPRTVGMKVIKNGNAAA